MSKSHLIIESTCIKIGDLSLLYQMGIFTEVIDTEPWATADIFRITLEALSQVDISQITAKHSRTLSMKVFFSENVIPNEEGSGVEIVH